LQIAEIPDASRDLPFILQGPAAFPGQIITIPLRTIITAMAARRMPASFDRAR